MVIYSTSKKEFVSLCREDRNGDIIANAVACSMRFAGIPFDEAQMRAWRNSLPPVAEVLDKTNVSDDCIVAAEYTIRQAKERLDFVISGKNSNNIRTLIVIELKQWSEVSVSNLDGFVVANVARGHREDHRHPSYQARNYSNIILNTYDIFQKEHINIYSCSYLHNMPNQFSTLIKDLNRFPLLSESPCFLKNDVDELVDFINSHISYNDQSLLVDIDSSKVITSRELSKMLLDALHGNNFYSYDDGQAYAVSKIKEVVSDKLHYQEGATILIKGGPGTGKSVVALHSLGELTKPIKGKKTGYNAIYCTNNAAPKNFYSQELIQGDFNKTQLKEFFKSPIVFAHTSTNEIDCTFFDEAHRLPYYSNMNIVKNVLDKAINSSRVSVFFIDEDQMVTQDDYATVDRIRETSEKLHKRVIEGVELKLTSQFRVLGGEKYMSFIRSFLGYDNLNLKYKKDNVYDFKVFDSISEMHDEIRNKDYEERINNANVLNKDVGKVSGYCRVVAGYCYEWDPKYGGSHGQFRDGDAFDIILENGNYKAKWNLRDCPQIPNDYSWLDDPLSVNEVGCIHTCQGLDFKYCGVIIGKDLIYREGNLFFDKTKNAKSDKTSRIKTADDELAKKLIRNTYNVLLTRGMKGTYVYCEDEALRDYLKSLVIE